MVTFGGAFSNHIAATASACHHYNIPCVGIIRGTYADPRNPTLQKAKAQGMQLHHIPKVEYKLKENSAEVQDILQLYERPYLIPEGGSNTLAMRGCAEAMDEINAYAEVFDYVILAAGTGMTAAGLISTKTSQKIIVVNVLKNIGLEDTITSHLIRPTSNWSVNNDFHCGGYAKTTPELIDFINRFNAQYNILLDPIYNGKAMRAAIAMIESRAFPEGARILYVLTGGQQGVTGYNYMCKDEGMRIITS